MNLTVHVLAMKVGALVFAGLTSAAVAAYGLGDPKSPPSRTFYRYAHALDELQKSLFLAPTGISIARAQCLAILAVWGAGLVLRSAEIAAVSVLLGGGPYVFLRRQKSRRHVALETQVQPFVLALANSLKTTPSLAQGFASVQGVLFSPMLQEVERALMEIRVGSTLEQALLAMSRRIRSNNFDAALCSILIGQKVGGELPEILKTTSHTLREMDRLQGVLRTHTASARTQLWVLAVVPGGLVLAFDWITPGYFGPLGSGWAGPAICAVAALLWVAAVLLARKLLAVSL